MHTVIAVDVGNTWVHVVKFKFSKAVYIRRLPTRTLSAQQLQRALSAFATGTPIVVCSVVPKVTALFMRIKKTKKFSKSISIVGKDIHVPIASLYNRKNIGMDRLVAAYSAQTLYPGTRFVLDFGTAITFDVLSKKGDYAGGFILPGVGSTLRVFSECALLPKNLSLRPAGHTVNLSRVPRDTSESIQRGVQEGFVLLVNAWVQKYRKIFRVAPFKAVVITGGDAAYLLKHLDFPFIYEPLLVAKGLRALPRR